MIRVLMLLCGIWLAGCSDQPRTTDKLPESTASETEKADRLARLAKLREDANKETDPLRKAEKQIKVLSLERDIAEQSLNETTVMLGSKEGELRKLKLAALQTKLYVGAGILFGIAVLLAALAFYFKSATMAYWAVGTAGVSCLVAFAGVLTPWVLEIAIAGGLLFLGFLLYLLFGRDKALFQLTKAVSEVKKEVPDFKRRFGYYIDEAQDVIIDATRKRWHDPDVR